MIKRNRLVALFDILGFASRLQTDDLATIRRELRLFIRTIRSEAFTNSAQNVTPENDDNLDTARFVFDSVILISHDVKNPRNVHNFVFACIRLLELGFLHRFPFRGSIALGDVFSDDETGLILGPQLPDLRDAERMQQWSGCFLHPSAGTIAFNSLCGERDYKQRASAPNGWQPLHLLDVPLKPEYVSLAPCSRWCLNWIYLVDQKAIQPGLEYLRGDPEKYANTKRYVEYVQGLPHNLTRPIDGKGVPPGTMIKTLNSRFGFRAKFVNQKGEAVAMPACTIHWTISSLDSDYAAKGEAKLPGVSP